MNAHKDRCPKSLVDESNRVQRVILHSTRKLCAILLNEKAEQRFSRERLVVARAPNEERSVTLPNDERHSSKILERNVVKFPRDSVKQLLDLKVSLTATERESPT
jgi:hypothetical protein